jgi:hypothetical protein
VGKKARFHDFGCLVSRLCELLYDYTNIRFLLAAVGLKRPHTAANYAPANMADRTAARRKSLHNKMMVSKLQITMTSITGCKKQHLTKRQPGKSVFFAVLIDLRGKSTH